jgi:hypothetical protein
MVTQTLKIDAFLRKYSSSPAKPWNSNLAFHYTNRATKVSQANQLAALPSTIVVGRIKESCQKKGE